MKRANTTPRQARLRLLLVFLLTVWIAEIFIVWKSPETIDQIAGAINTGIDKVSATTPKTAESAPAEPAVTKPPAKKVASPRRSTPRAVAIVAEEISAPAEINAPLETAEAPPQEKPAPPPKVNRSEANVKTDTVAVHLSNSADSPVVQVLSKGAPVEARLQVIDSKGPWSLIKIPGGAGFVRSETLEYRQGATDKR